MAVVGASERDGNLGGRLIKALKNGGYKGEIYAVHPTASEVFGVPSFSNIRDIGKTIDFAALSVPDSQLLRAYEEAIAAGVKGFQIPNRGYDAERKSLTYIPDRLRELGLEAGVAVCGHNCMGFMNVRDSVRMTHNPPPGLDLTPGGVCIVSHSGSSWSGIVGSQRDLALDIALSAGAEVVSGFPEYIEYFASLPTTRVIGLVVETIRRPEAFLAAVGNAFQKGIPVVLLALGSTDVGAKFTEAHSGGLSSPRQVLDAIGRKYGVIVTKTLDEFLDCIEAFRTERVPTALGAGVISDSGGERQLIADVSSWTNLKLATYGHKTNEQLTQILEDDVVIGNPLDSMGDAPMADSGIAISRDPAVGAVVIGNNLVDGRQFMIDVSNSTTKIHENTAKPVFIFGNLSTSVSRPGARNLRMKGIPVLMGTESACYAIGSFLAWHEKRRALGDTASTSRDSGHNPTEELPRLADTFTQDKSYALLAECGLPMALMLESSTLADTVKNAQSLGYPVVLKTANPDIAHKSDVGGVILGIRSDEELARHYAVLSERCGPQVSLQPALSADYEVIVGMHRDPRFGPLVTVGLGGVFTEILRDSVNLLPPVSFDEFEASLNALRAAAVLRGARGQQAISLRELYNVVVKISEFALQNPGITGIDLNPIMVRHGKLTIVDALITV
ncbi:acetate--CoA ligase family protein [Aminobacter sp. LjRoot7]|uniref:acetate--CoA ligase family protein n=1 Tax=Aminobacter sp. LjRoot7 TaxID=3342335 RepID=UPI003ECD6D27